MIKGIKYIWVIIILTAWGATTTMIAQRQMISTLTCNVDSVKIGDPVTLDIEVICPVGMTIDSIDFSGYKFIDNLIYGQDTVFMEKYADLEILDFGQWKHQDINKPVTAPEIKYSTVQDRQYMKNTITIAIYNAGIFSIPGPVLITKENVEILPAEKKTIRVFLPEKLSKQDTVAFNPIKDIMKEKAELTDYLVYVYILIAILLMVTMGYVFYRIKKKNNQLILQEPESIIPPHEKALTALKALEDKQLWQQGFIKDYQSGLTDIIRTYLEERYHIRALEMTTEETLSELAKAGFDSAFTIALKEILSIADLVKFAGALPGEDVHQRFMVKAVDFVEHTKNEEMLS